MPYTFDNIEITIANENTAFLATDYGTSGAVGFSLAHAQHAKVAWGDENSTYRTTESTPLPVKITGFTGSSVGVTGTIRGTGDFFVRTNPTVPLIVKGSTFSSDAPLAITGAIQGIANGVAVGVTGSVSILGSNGIYGITNGYPVAITGGRSLTYGTDSVRVFGSVGLSGGLALSSTSSSITVYGESGSTFFNTKIYSGSGTSIGASGDALKVAVTNAGFTFSVSVGASVGVTNNGGPLRVQGYTGTGTPITVIGENSRALAVVAYSNLPVGVCGAVEIVDTDIIDTIEGLKTNINSVSTNAAYALDIFNLMNSSGPGARVAINSISRPSRMVHGVKSLTTTAVVLGNESLRTGVTIKSPISNTVDILIGNSFSNVGTNGYPLSPGETIFIEVSSLAALFVRSSTGTATINYIGS